MIKVSVMYPNTPGARFDHEYYRDQHMPMVKDKLGNACKGIAVDQGIGNDAPYAAVCHLFFETAEAFQPAFRPHDAPIATCH